MAKKGFFLVFEGLDGSGCSTQTNMLAGYLRKKGLQVVETKEPTNGLIGGLIRSLLKGEWSSSQECLQLLFAADRAYHLEREIIPALEKNYIVVCDRYILSSLAFGSLDVDINWLRKINSRFPAPDLTFLLRVSPEECLHRIRKTRFSLQLFEKKPEMERVYENYLKLKNDIIVEIDGERAVDDVHADVVKTIRNKLNIEGG